MLEELIESLEITGWYQPSCTLTPQACGFQNAVQSLHLTIPPAPVIHQTSEIDHNRQETGAESCRLSQGKDLRLNILFPLDEVWHRSPPYTSAMREAFASPSSFV